MKQQTISKGVEGIKAILSSGIFVKVDAVTFLTILANIEAPLIVVSHERILFSAIHKYLTTYRGLIFCTESNEPLILPQGSDMIEAKRIWMPNY